MKNFNKMTEMQMTKANGGVSNMVLGFVGVTCIVVGTAGLAVGVSNDNNQNPKQ